MAKIGCYNLCRSEFYYNVSAKNKVQDMNLNLLKLKVNDTYKKDEKMRTNFEAVNDEGVINKAFKDTKLSKKEGQVSKIETKYNEFKLHNSKQSIEDV